MSRQDTDRHRKNRRSARAGAQYLLGLAAFLAVWWGGSLLAGPSVLPAPPAVVRHLLRPGVVVSFLRSVSLTAGRGLLGFSIAWIVALPLGVAMGRRGSLERIGFFPLMMLQSAPPLFWVTPLVLWLGTRGMVAPVVALFVSLPLLSVHTMMAIKAIPPYEYDLFSAYAPRAIVVARELYLPKLLPALKGNIHLGLLVSIKVAMLAEWFAAQDGFGQTIRVYYQYFAMTEFLSWALMFLILIGGVSFGLRGLLVLALPSYRQTQIADTETAASEHRTDGVAHEPARQGCRPDLSNRLIVESLTCGYHRRPVFEGVDLKLNAARPVVLYGPSGCGKTTLLKCLAGLRRPWSGSIHLGTEHRPAIGLVFQEDALLGHRDAIGNVLLPSMPHPTRSDLRRAQAALSEWGLGDEASKFPHELSGGMRKRLAVARAWYLDPPVLLLDEPFVNLDSEARAALWKLLVTRLAQRHVAALIVTHYPEELNQFDVEMRSWSSLAS